MKKNNVKLAKASDSTDGYPTNKRRYYVFSTSVHRETWFQESINSYDSMRFLRRASLDTQFFFLIVPYTTPFIILGLFWKILQIPLRSLYSVQVLTDCFLFQLNSVAMASAQSGIAVLAA